MSLGHEVADFLVETIGQIAATGAHLDAEQRARIADTLRQNAAALSGIQPNLPRIHELAEKRRAEIAAGRTSIADAVSAALELDGDTD